MFVLASILLITAVLGGVVSVDLGRCSADCAPGADTARQAGDKTPPPGPAKLSVAPGRGATDVDPLAPVTVSATSGTLTEVVMVNEQGNRIAGITTPDNAVWKPGVPLGYGRTYTVTASAVGTNGAPTQQVSTFSTLTPSNQTKVSLTTTAGIALRAAPPTALAPSWWLTSMSRSWIRRPLSGGCR